MKLKRQSKITELIKSHEIETQEELGERLSAAGFSVTQATISRDIRDLKLTKIAREGGGQRYAVLAQETPRFSERFLRIYRDAAVSVDHSGNLIVIKTYEGMAMAVAACIDAMGFYEILGSIAGDDTIFCAMRGEEAAAVMAEKFKGILNGGKK